MNELIDKFWDWALGDVPRNPVPYHDDDDLVWVTAVIPMVITQSSICYEGEEAMEHCGPRLGPDWEKFKATSMRQFWYLLKILPQHMDTLDPEGTSGAYRMLQNWDPEFRKITIFGKLHSTETVELPKELHDLEYLASYIFVNVMARFHRVNVDMAEEALLITKTRHFIHFKMIFEEGKTLADVRADRLKHKKLEAARNARDPMLRLEFQVPLM
ncbi:unnamed protein product [Fusarium equiseti]|uniref:Uncharacterized protein n=1 Tax=Fusarium equiseti TaxID=61235 RepID=A0A8J2NAW7_FUSEQ|nr:unnamed protein product [Fusarium equiseti]